MNAMVTEGPARSAMAAAVRTNRPAPMIAPMPRATRAHGPSVRLSAFSPVSDASASRESIDLVAKRPPPEPGWVDGGWLVAWLRKPPWSGGSRNRGRAVPGRDYTL